MAAKRKHPLPSAEAVRQLFKYDAETGLMTWREPTSKFSSAYAGKPVGTMRSDGYVLIGVRGRMFGAHRLAALIMTGEWPIGDIDHINGIRHDNRWSNLRVVSAQVNQQNRRRANANGRAGLLGVNPYKNKFRAYIKIDGRTKYLGSYETADRAHAEYVAAKRQFHEGCTL